MGMKYFPRKPKGNGYTPEETVERLEEVLAGFDKRLMDVEKTYKFGRRMGEDISLFCPGCGNQHTIPYIPGTYRMCKIVHLYGNNELNYVIVNKDGTIEYSSEDEEE